MQKIGHIRRFALAGALLAGGVLTVTGQAAAKGCKGNVNQNPPSSVAQYTEQIPTSCGSHVTGTGTHTRKLPRVIERRIASQGGSAATQKLLTKIATSEKYGAPSQKLPRRYQKIHTPKASSSHNALAASVSVVTDGSDGRLIGLVALMAVTALIALGASVYRRRAAR